MSAFTVGDFQSTHHHSFIDSSGSASIPSSLIHKLRTAILIALRTVEVFNGLLCSRGIRTVQCADSRCEVFQKHHAYSWEIHQRQVFTKETEHSFPQIAAISWSQHHTYTHTQNRQLRYWLTKSSSMITSTTVKYLSQAWQESAGFDLQPGNESPSMFHSETESLYGSHWTFRHCMRRQRNHHMWIPTDRADAELTSTLGGGEREFVLQWSYSQFSGESIERLSLN